MMAELKTKQHEGDVLLFIKDFANTEQKQEDSFKLIKIMENLTGCPAKMWGSSIIGFGSYHYKSERSNQEGDWPLIGFSPRKAAISLYVFSGSPEHEYLLKDLGKYKRGKACIYINKLSDIDQKALERLIRKTIEYLGDNYKISTQ
jgi:hypothetical protein